MGISLKGGSTTNLAEVSAAGELSTTGSVKALTYASSTASIAATLVGSANAAVGSTGGAPVMYVIVKNSAPSNLQLNFEGNDGSGNWMALLATRHETGISAPSHNLTGFISSGLGGWVFSVPAVGFTQIRCRLDINTSAQVTAFTFQPAALSYAPVATTVPARVPVTLFNLGVVAAGTATESVFILQRVKINPSTGIGQSSGNFYQVPAGRTFRLQSVTFTQVGNSTATAAQTFFRLRGDFQAASYTGTIAQVLANGTISTPATAFAFDSLTWTFSDGMDIWGGTSTSTSSFLNVTYYSQYTTNAPTLGVTMVGYEY